jgi:hypothetical protein
MTDPVISQPCPICKGKGTLTGPGPMGTTVRCVCNPAPEPVEPPTPAVRQPRRGYSERLNS